MKSGVYNIINLQDGKVYVGSSIDFTRRLDGHLKGLRQGKHPNVVLQRAWEKHGEQAFHFGLLTPCVEQDLISTEQFCIDTLSAADRRFGYNLSPTAGGTFGYQWSEESKILLSAAISRKMKDQNHRQTLSEAALRKYREHPELALEHSLKLRGRKNKPHSSATKELIAESKRGKARPPEMVARIAQKLRGRKNGPHSVETRARISASKLGYVHPPEVIARIAEKNQGRPAWNKGQVGVVKCSLTVEQRSARAQKVWATRRSRGTDCWANK